MTCRALAPICIESSRTNFYLFARQRRIRDYQLVHIEQVLLSIRGVPLHAWLPPFLSRIEESLEPRRSVRVECAGRLEKDGARRRPYAAQPICCVIHCRDAGDRSVGLRNDDQIGAAIGVLPDDEHRLAAPGMERVVDPPLDRVLVGSMSLVRTKTGSDECRFSAPTSKLAKLCRCVCGVTRFLIWSSRRRRERRG